jgi:hypothetical protein
VALAFHVQRLNFVRHGYGKAQRAVRYTAPSINRNHGERSAEAIRFELFACRSLPLEMTIVVPYREHDSDQNRDEEDYYPCALRKLGDHDHQRGDSVATVKCTSPGRRSWMSMRI